MTTARRAGPITCDDIVVGVDPVPGGRPAVSWAIDAARAGGRRVTLVRAVDLSAHRSWLTDRIAGGGLASLFWPAMRREADRARREAGPGVRVRGLVLPGRPTPVLTRLARQADQVVVLHEVVDEQQAIYTDVPTIPVTVAGDLAAAARQNVGVHDLLVVGNREVDLPAPPVVDHVLLPLLRRPRQVLVVVPDHATDGERVSARGRPGSGRG